MTFLELWGERVDPGEIGSVEISAEHEACPSRVLTIAKFAFVLFALPLLWGLALPMIPLPAWQSACLLVGGTLIYTAIGYLVRPEPNFDNVGLGGGLIDHPGRYSDDINRELIGANMLLGPGRFIAESLVDFVLLWQRKAEPMSARAASARRPPGHQGKG
jgi:hypothetical protein